VDHGDHRWLPSAGTARAVLEQALEQALKTPHDQAFFVPV
jgi:hypothetical protein